MTALSVDEYVGQILCITCRFWDNDVARNYGWCRRHAPVVNAMEIFEFYERDRKGQLKDDEPGPDSPEKGYWPITHCFDWCGEWEETNRETIEHNLADLVGTGQVGLRS